MQIKYLSNAEIELNFWVKSGNKKMLSKINSLIHSIALTPYSSIGKPEQLKHKFTGCWSRRINKEHRLIYRVEDDIIYIILMRGHY